MEFKWFMIAMIAFAAAMCLGGYTQTTALNDCRKFGMEQHMTPEAIKAVCEH